MPLLLVDALEPAEAAALRAHLAGGCPRCSSYLAEADATLSYLPYALEPQAPRAAARDRLFAKLDVPPPAGDNHDRGHHRGAYKMPAWVRASLPAVVAACLAVVVTGHFMLEAMSKQRGDLLAKISTRDQRINVLSNQVQSSHTAIEVFYQASRQITLQGRAQSRAQGKALWDAKRECWHFRAFGLDPLGPKEAYQLWFVTPYGRKVPGGTFKPDAEGAAQMIVTLPKDVGPVASALVTDEPSVGTFQPTGTVQLSGKTE